MTFLDKLKEHIGGLIRIKTELYWFNPRSPGDPPKADGTPGRVFLLLDARREISHAFIDACPAEGDRPRSQSASILVFFDGMFRWIWVWCEVLEFIDTQDNPDGSQKIF